MSNSIYKGYSSDELQELFSNFLVDSWSYSKVSSFARNEKAFEMQYIFGLYSKSSSTTIAGNAYHHALDYYFSQKKHGRTIDLVELEASAFAYLDNIEANKWKIQKTTPTVEACQKDATTKVSSLLRNFVAEKGIYEDEIADILDVEAYFDEFLTVNGVDIPLPCHAKIDLVVRKKEGGIAVVDHKSKKAYTPDDEISLATGVQAMTYVLCYESKTGHQVNEVWFVENKYTQNKDKSPQLARFPISIEDNTRRIYEALLYEKVKRMVEAVSNPDYVFLINDSDNLVDMAQLYDFWIRTMICEVDDFNVDAAKKSLVAKRMKKIRDASIDMIPPAVLKRFKETPEKFITYDLSDKNMANEEKIEHVLRSFGVIARVAHTFEGYSSNTFLLEVSAGVKVASIFKYQLDIANALNVRTVRFSSQMVIHEGRSYLSVEFEKARETTLEYNVTDLSGFKIPIGKDNFNNTVIWDLENQSTPHMLVCGGTGSGKSVFLNSTIAYALEAGVDEVYIMDPKYEFKSLHDQSKVFVYNDIIEIEEQMALLVKEMEQLVRTGRKKWIMVVFDEFADAIENSRKGPQLDIKEMVQVGNYAPKKGLFGIMEPGEPKMKMQTTGTLKSLEENMRILLQKGRSSGFRIIAAMQRASVKVITGDAKVNMPVQVCFRVNKDVDSKVVLDEAGAEGLAGAGDGLIKSPQYNDIIRFQAYFKA